VIDLLLALDFSVKPLHIIVVFCGDWRDVLHSLHVCLALRDRLAEVLAPLTQEAILPLAKVGGVMLLLLLWDVHLSHVESEISGLVEFGKLWRWGG
jgi:hypothetical protein